MESTKKKPLIILITDFDFHQGIHHNREAGQIIAAHPCGMLGARQVHTSIGKRPVTVLRMIAPDAFAIFICRAGPRRDIQHQRAALVRSVNLQTAGTILM